MKPRVHFVGIHGEQYIAAVKVFGVPDVTHAFAMWSNMGEIPAHDIVVFGDMAFKRLSRRQRERRGQALRAHDVPEA